MRGTRTQVAVIGAGVSGLTAAHVLSTQHEVTLFEKSPRLGGHADTVQHHGLALDLAFMVFNEHNYPSLVRLLAELGVRSQPSEMSMSMSCAGCDLSVLCGSPLRPLPAQVAGVDRRQWQRARADLERLAVQAGGLARSGSPGPTLGQLLEDEAVSGYAASHLMLPLVSAVWSCGEGTARRYPAGYLFRFLLNHGLLPESEPIRWRTIIGGSRTYVEAIASRLAHVHRGTPVRHVARSATGVQVRDAADRVHRFGAAVIAAHPHQALAMLEKPTARERALLAAVPYTGNDAVLHTDTSWLPADPADRAAWNHRRSSCEDGAGPVVMSYYLNRLQRIDAPVDYILTLNPDREIDPDSILRRRTYHHPQFTPDSVPAAHAIADLSDTTIAYAGAYQGWGFHEDGCASGVRAARDLGVTW